VNEEAIARAGLQSQINNTIKHLFKTTIKYQTPSVKLFAQPFAHPVRHSDLNADVWYEVPD
jgi:hypothetical protein